MTDDRLTQLQEVAELTAAMLEMAKAAQWTELATCQQKRNALLEQIFPLQPEQQTEKARILISSILEQNHQLELLCRRERQARQKELHDLNKNRRALAAYLSR